jgi:hypothetical protein
MLNVKTLALTMTTDSLCGSIDMATTTITLSFSTDMKDMIFNDSSFVLGIWIGEVQTQ